MTAGDIRKNPRLKCTPLSNSRQQNCNYLNSYSWPPMNWNSRPFKEILNQSLFNISNKSRLSFGLPRFDQALRNGITLGTICEIVGISGSGKTQAVMNIIATMLVRCLNDDNFGGSGVYFIYTEGKAPLGRLKEILSEKLRIFGSLDKVKVEEYTHLLLSNVFVDHVSTDKELWEIITQRIVNYIHQLNIKLIVIDSIAAPFRAVDDNSRKYFANRASKMFCLSSVLKRISHENNLYVVVTNQVSDVITDDKTRNPNLSWTANPKFEKEICCFNDKLSSRRIQPVLGLSWSSCINYRIFLQRLLKDDGELSAVRIGQIMLAPDVPPNDGKLYFTITKFGLIDL